LFRFVLDFLVSFKTVCFGCSASILKQRVSMFQLNRNKQKTNRKILIEDIFWYFKENFGLFRCVSKQFFLFWFFEIGLKHRNKPKQVKIFCYWFHRNRSSFGLFRFEPKFLFVFVWFENTLAASKLSSVKPFLRMHLKVYNRFSLHLLPKNRQE